MARFTSDCPYYEGYADTYIAVPQQFGNDEQQYTDQGYGYSENYDPGQNSWNNTEYSEGSEFSQGTDPSVFDTQYGNQTVRPVKPGKVNGISVKAKGKGKIRINWNRAGHTTRYMIKVSTDRNLRKARTYYTSGRRLSLSGLKSGRKYYVSIKAINDTEYGTYGKWSRVKKVSVK